MRDALPIYTIGHSNHSLMEFLQLLSRSDITALADVRSVPSSKWAPHFNGDELRRELARHNIAYVFLGNELGGRPRDRHLYKDGVADYEAMAQSPGFRDGIRRVSEGARVHRIALMCSEQEPLDCHRCLLVGRALSCNHTVHHIHPNGAVEAHSETERRLLESEKRGSGDLFVSLPERLAAAYQQRARRVAFSERRDEPRNLRGALR